MKQVPVVGRFVDYTLAAYDVQRIQQRRAEGSALGNQTATGDVFPMLITRVWGNTPESSVNGTVFLDGEDTLWVTSRAVGEDPGFFKWPVIR